MHPSINRTKRSLMIFPFILAMLTLIACEMRLQIPSSANAPDIPPYEFEATGEDFLISALEEVQAIADWSQSFQNGFGARLSDGPMDGKKTILSITSTDTVYIYGEITPGGYGAVVTERYARPKGLLLITIRKTYGKGNGHVVTETKRYASYADHLGNNPQQTNVTEMYGAQTDTIVTHVLRNGTLQTYTFRLPVVTRVVNPQDGSIRITSRYASNGKILSRVTDGDGDLVQLRSSYGQSDGSTVTRTEYPDGSWSQVRTHGEADGTVTREATSGLPTIGSGNGVILCPPPRPVLGFWSGMDADRNLFLLVPVHICQRAPLLASGQAVPGSMPRPVSMPYTMRASSERRARISRNIASELITSASGNLNCPRPPLPSLVSGITLAPRPPRPRMA